MKMRKGKLALLTVLGLLASSSLALAQDSRGDEHRDHAMSGTPASTPSHDPAHSHDDMVAPKTPTLLTGYGKGGFAITAAVPAAQAFFSNGLELGAAFAHKASIEAMTEAVRLDPACAMCLWGQALVSGPTINYGKDDKERVPLLKMAQQARSMAAKGGSARESDLTKALALRYLPGGKPIDHDRAYAAAMQKLATAYPADNEIAVLAADAMMVASFGKSDDDFDHPQMEQVVALLEGVLARDPDHTPAIHFYIHAEEALDHPEKAEPFANRLAGLAPRASHLVHMPSHTFYWLGRYQDAADTNWRAVEIGKDNAKRLGLEGPMGVWGLPYHAHNVIFGLGGAMMAGDSRMALNLAGPLVEKSSQDEKAGPASQLLAAAGYFAMARFEDPARVLALPEPKLPYLKAARHYARGEALLWLRDVPGAQAELAAIPEKIAEKAERENRAAEQMLGITRKVLTGRIAMIEGRFADAAKAFGEAADIEETRDFRYFSDPPAFWYPVRRDVAAALLAAGDAAGARLAASASLKLRPRDPVALALLERAEAAVKPIR